MKKTLHRGTTLVEVVVSSMLLVSIIGLITMSLVAVFEGYAVTQQRGEIDQDGQYILARIKYVGSQQDSQTIYSQTKTPDFTQTGSLLTNIESSPSEDGGIYLTNTSIVGEYISPTISLLNPSLATYFVASVKRPTGTTIKYRIALADPISGSCDNAQYVYVGEGKSPTAYFTTDYFLIPADDDGTGYENPASCIRYKAYLESETSQTPIVYSAFIKR
jgi:hypothetical protein